MIDLHCHLLPGIDDGAPDLATSLQMVKALVDDGVEAAVCTPHILPGLYDNRGPQVRKAVARLREAIRNNGLPLDIHCGADAHIAVDFEAKLKRGEILTLAESRYVLIELPQHTGPIFLKQFFFRLLVGGYVPVLSHPERLSWIESQYEVIKDLARSGTWLQVTAGSLLGNFGRAAKYWSERMLDEGLVHVLATDAHNLRGRAPNLGRGRDTAAKRVGEREALNLVAHRPRSILKDEAPARISLPTGVATHAELGNI